MLSGHGCFGKYLHSIKKEASPRYHHCDAFEDTAEYIIFHCPSWKAERTKLGRILEGFDPETVAGKMVNSEVCWKAVTEFSSTVLRAKEEAERTRRGKRHVN